MKGKYNYLICDLCKGHIDSQREALTCPMMTTYPDIKYHIDNMQYDDMYGSLTQQINAAKTWTMIIDARKRMTVMT